MRQLGVIGLAVGLVACVDSGGGDIRAQNPTAIAVAPEDFLGAVPCADAPGGLRRYVVTLHDVTDPDGPGFPLPSAGPVDCRRTTSFGFVVPDHRYVARVDAYDRSDIAPLGGPGSGSAVMVDAVTQAFVSPRWTTTCSGAPELDATSADAGSTEAGAPASCEADPDPLAGRAGAVTCESFLTRRVAACRPLCDRGGSAETGLAVRIDNALFELQCGIGPGQVATFRAERAGSGELPRSASCGQAITFTSGVTAGKYASFDVTAFENGKTDPTWKTLCWGTPAAGTVLPASCDPLVPIAPEGDL